MNDEKPSNLHFQAGMCHQPYLRWAAEHERAAAITCAEKHQRRRAQHFAAYGALQLRELAIVRSAC